MHIINGELEGKPGEEIIYWAYCYEHGSTPMPTWDYLSDAEKYSWKMIYETSCRYAPYGEGLKERLRTALVEVQEWRALKAHWAVFRGYVEGLQRDFMEADIATRRDTQIRTEMEGKPTPLYDRLKAQGLEPPATVMLIGDRKPTGAEVAYGLALERELDNLEPTRKRIIGRMRAAIRCLKDGQYIDGAITDGLYEVGVEISDEIAALKAKVVEYAKNALLDTISDISETYWAASWQEGIVAAIKKAVTDPEADQRVWGRVRLNESEVVGLRRLSEDAGGWPDDGGGWPGDAL